MIKSKQTEILIKSSSEQIKAFVESLHKDGKKPCERFGISWEELAELDKLIFDEKFKEDLRKTHDRRVELGKRMNSQKLCCPECKTRQVQLVGYIDIIPAEWRCRHCKYEFNWESY